MVVFVVFIMCRLKKIYFHGLSIVLAQLPSWLNFPLAQFPSRLNFLWLKFHLAQVPSGSSSHWLKFPLARVPSGSTSLWLKFPLAQVPSGSSSLWLKFPMAQVPSGSSSLWLNFPLAQFPTGSSSIWLNFLWHKFTRSFWLPLLRFRIHFLFHGSFFSAHLWLCSAKFGHGVFWIGFIFAHQLLIQTLSYNGGLCSFSAGIEVKIVVYQFLIQTLSSTPHLFDPTFKRRRPT